MRVIYLCNKLVIDKSVIELKTRMMGGSRNQIRNIWKMNEMVKKIINSGLWMLVGNGQNMLFWEDSWISDQFLRDKYPRLYAVSSQKNRAISEYGFWNGLEWVRNLQGRRQLCEWEKHFLEDLQVLLLQVFLNANSKDQVIWKHHSLQIYSVRSFIQPAKGLQNTHVEPHSTFRDIWRGVAPPRAELLTWFTIIGKLKTKGYLHKINILHDGDLRCVLCKSATESVNHLFLEYAFT